jgi:hypothetical protein
MNKNMSYYVYYVNFSTQTKYRGLGALISF